jgi:hypothetical protein
MSHTCDNCGRPTRGSRGSFVPSGPIYITVRGVTRKATAEDLARLGVHLGDEPQQPRRGESTRDARRNRSRR